MSTPIQQLEAAVAEYLEATAVEGDLHGFVLLAATSKIDPDADAEGLMPLGWQYAYAATAPPDQALGLVTGFARLASAHVSGAFEESA